MCSLVSILRIAYTSPSNSFYLALDIAISPSNSISAHPITLVSIDLRSTVFPCDEVEGSFSDPVECTENFRCVGTGDGGLIHDGSDYGSGGFFDGDAYSCNSSAYLRQGSACFEVHAVGDREGERHDGGASWFKG